eukprot:GEMP01098426.1.p1 GENE.GEMP01098426.1~~GEMP01098426.1.p1  ORF type:complete len:123 (-),score=6.65 GEMP01098426.1:394-762(-)
MGKLVNFPRILYSGVFAASFLIPTYREGAAFSAVLCVFDNKTKTNLDGVYMIILRLCRKNNNKTTFIPQFVIWREIPVSTGEPTNNDIFYMNEITIGIKCSGFAVHLSLHPKTTGSCGNNKK